MASTVVQGFKEHPLWAEIEALEAVLSSTREMLDENNLEDASSHASLVALADHIRRILRAVNPMLVSTTTMDAIQATLNQCRNNLDSFEANSQVVYLTNAWTASTGVVNSLNALPVVKTKSDVKGIAEAVAGFEVQVANRVKTLTDQLNENETSLDELRAGQKSLATETGEQKGVLAEAVATFEQQLAAERQDRDAKFAEELEKVETTLENALEESTNIRTQETALRTGQMTQFEKQFADLTEDVVFPGRAGCRRARYPG